MAVNPITSEALTIDYKSLMRIPIGRRALAASTSSEFTQAILSSLSPFQIAQAFPDYYRKSLPDISNFITSNIQSKLSGRGQSWNQIGGGQEGGRREYYDGSQSLDSNVFPKTFGVPADSKDKRKPPKITASEFRAVESNPYLAGYVDKTLKKESEGSKKFEHEHERARYIINKLLDAGLTKEAALSTVANLMQESYRGLLTGAIGDAGQSFGIAQWQKDRFENLKSYATEINADWNDLEVQTGFLIREMLELKPSSKGRGNVPGNPENNFIIALNNAKTEQEREKILRENYEVGIYDSEAYMSHLEYLKKGIFVEEETAVPAEQPDSMRVVQRVAEETAIAEPTFSTANLVGENIINELGYSVPVTGKLLHEGHGRTSEFGYGRGRLHAGVDVYSTDPETGKLRVGSNAPVSAPMDGKVVMIRKDRGRAGNYIEIQDKNGYKHRFLHTAKDPAINPTTGKKWKVGDTVSQGQVVTHITGSGTKFDAKVKELGGNINAALDYFDRNGWQSVNKPHLHYEVRDSNGRLINPGKIFPEYSGKEKEKLSFTNKNDMLKNLLVTGQITQDEYNKKLGNSKTEEAITRSLDVVEKTSDAAEQTQEKKKPLSIIDYSRPQEAIRNDETETTKKQFNDQVPKDSSVFSSSELYYSEDDDKSSKPGYSVITPSVPKLALGGNLYGINEDLTLSDTKTGQPIAQINQNERLIKQGNALQVTSESKLKADELSEMYDMSERMDKIESSSEPQQSQVRQVPIEKVNTNLMEEDRRWQERVANAQYEQGTQTRAFARVKFLPEGYHFSRNAPNSIT